MRRHSILPLLSLLLLLRQPLLAQSNAENPVAAELAPVLVTLDATGISDWTFLNPVAALELNGRGVMFKNNTGGRTFVITMPFVYKESEFKTVFAAAGARRGGHSLADIACSVAPCRPAPRCRGEATCPETDRTNLVALEQLRQWEEAVVHTETADVAKETCTPTDAKCLPTGCLVSDASCALDFIYWAGTCSLSDRELTRLVYSPDVVNVEAMRGAAATVVRAMFGDEPSLALPSCPDEDRKPVDRRRSIAQRRAIALPTETASQAEYVTGIEQASSRERDEAEKKLFAQRRATLASAALINAIQGEENEILKGTENHRGALQDFLDRLDADYQSYEKAVTSRGLFDPVRHLPCLEATARLLASYRSGSAVPFDSSIFDDPNAECGGLAGLPEPERRERIAAIPLTPHRRFPEGASITDCKLSGGSETCVASLTLGPYQTGEFGFGIIEHHPSERVQFKVAFFGQTEPPPNAAGYVLRGRLSDANLTTRRKKAATTPEFTIGIGSQAATAYDLTKDLAGHTRHATGGGTLAFQYSGAVDASASLGIKKGDLGGASTTNQVTVNQYQAKIFGPADYGLQFGRFKFAEPASAVALSESGEGIRFIHRNFALSYLVRRESDTGEADQRDRDNYSLLAQANNLAIPGPIHFLQLADLYATYGHDRFNGLSPKNKAGEKPTYLVGHTYSTVGGEVHFAFEGRGVTAGSFAMFHSTRHVDPFARDAACAEVPEPQTCPTYTPPVDGRGTVALLTLSSTWRSRPSLKEINPSPRPPFGPTVILGYGTGDNRSTPNRNEGYAGENAGFANDEIFLSTIAAQPQYVETIGAGLANKRYLGLQWSDARRSLLGDIARTFFQAAEQIESEQTIFTIHNYWLAHDINNSSYAGAEANLEFQVETPKAVRWSLKTAYYVRGTALRTVLRSPHLWAFSANVSLQFNR